MLDANLRTCELFGVINIPATVWFDEDGRIVKPPTIAPGDDRWRDYTGQFYRVHHDDRSLAFIVLGPRTYRAPLSELR